MRKLLLLAVLCVTAFAASLNIPSSAFMALGCTWPATYCSGYNMGAGVAASILPSAAGIATYQQYKAIFTSFYRAQYDNNGVVLSGNVGYDNALEDGANYEWIHDPLSGHNVVIQ